MEDTKTENVSKKIELKTKAYIRRPDGHCFTIYPVKDINETGNMILITGPDDKLYAVSPNNVMIIQDKIPKEQEDTEDETE